MKEENKNLTIDECLAILKKNAPSLVRDLVEPHYIKLKVEMVRGGVVSCEVETKQYKKKG